MTTIPLTANPISQVPQPQLRTSVGEPPMTENLQDSSESKRARWNGAPLKDRLQHFKTIYVKHRSIGKVTKFIERELMLRQVEECATGVLVIAGSGSGKSSFVEFLRRQYPDVDTPELSIRPVVCFHVPAVPSPSSMGSALLKALGDPVHGRGTWEEKKDRAEKLLLKAKTIIVAIDDFQDVPSKRKARGVEHVANWIRDVCDFKFPGLVVALGTEQAAVVRDAHEQLLRRMQPRFELPVFSMESADDIKHFRTLLDLVDEQLPLGLSSNLKSAHLARPLIAASNGILDYMMKLLLRAVVRAVERQSERIDFVDLELAFEDLHQVAARAGNPFSPGWNGNALTGPGQIFGLAREAAEAEDKALKKSRSRKAN